MSKKNKNSPNVEWWNNNPMTYVEEEIENWSDKSRLVGSKEQFITLNNDYLDTNPWLNDFFAKYKKDKTLEKLKVLDIGTGWGSSSLLLESLGCDVTAIDLSNTSIEGAKKNHSFFGQGSIQLLQMDAEKLDFPDDSFDYAFSWGVIHHSNCTENALSEIRRVLKPGGKGMLMVYNRLSTRYYLIGFWYLFFKGKIFAGENFQSVQKYFTDGYWHRHFSSKEFTKILNEQGLEVDSIELSYMARRMIPGMKDGSKLDNWLKRKFGWLLIANIRKDV